MIEKLTPWTPNSEVPKILKGSYGRKVTDEYAWCVQGNIFIVKAFKNINFVVPIKCYTLNKLDGTEFDGTLLAGECAIGILQ